MKEENEKSVNVDADKDLVTIEQEVPKHGLSLWTAGIFIVGEIAGSGVLALPNAVEGIGAIGIPIIILCGLVAAYTAGVLGTSWCIVRDRYEEYRGHVRYPYPAMAAITYGKIARYLVSFSVNFTMYGSAVVYLILASQNLYSLMHNNVTFCYWILIVGAVLTPVTWFGTPKDFWPIAIGAATSTGIACVLLTIHMVMDKEERSEVIHKAPGFTTFFAAFGTMCFSFGGHPMYPTFQTDMKHKNQFGKAVVLAYTIVLAMYIPVSTTGYFVYGKDVKANILQTVTNNWMLTTVEILVTVHLFCGVVILLNPISQEVEETFKIPKRFNWKRCVVRTLIMCVTVFGAESVPKFGNVLSLVGGSTVAALAFIFPPLIYLKLTKMEGPWEKVHVPLHKTVFMYEIMLVGVVAGVAATYSAIADLLSPGSFTLPCYVNMTAVVSS